MVADDAIVAVDWGTTMQAVADALGEGSTAAHAQVVALVGGLHTAELGTSTNEIAIQFGQRLGAAVRPLLAPVYVQDQATAAGLAKHPGVHGSGDSCGTAAQSATSRAAGSTAAAASSQRRRRSTRSAFRWTT